MQLLQLGLSGWILGALLPWLSPLLVTKASGYEFERETVPPPPGPDAPPHLPPGLDQFTGSNGKPKKGLDKHELAAEIEFRHLIGNLESKFHHYFTSHGFEPGPVWREFKDADKETVLKNELRASHWLKHNRPKIAREFRVKAKRLEFLEMMTRQNLMNEEAMLARAQADGEQSLAIAKQAKVDMLKGRVHLWQKLQEKHYTDHAMDPFIRKPFFESTTGRLVAGGGAVGGVVAGFGIMGAGVAAANAGRRSAHAAEYPPPKPLPTGVPARNATSGSSTPRN